MIMEFLEKGSCDNFIRNIGEKAAVADLIQMYKKKKKISVQKKKIYNFKISFPI